MALRVNVDASSAPCLNWQGTAVSYTHSNANWKVLLTAYSGQTISYNALRIPLPVADASETAITSPPMLPLSAPSATEAISTPRGRSVHQCGCSGVIIAAPRLRDASLFAYCGNNPVNYANSEGEFAIVAMRLASVALAAAVTWQARL